MADVVLCEGPGVVEVGPRRPLRLPLLLPASSELALLAGAHGDGAVGAGLLLEGAGLLEVAGQLLVEAVVGPRPLPGAAAVPPLGELLLVAGAPAVGVVIAAAGQPRQRHASPPLVKLGWVS